MKIIKTFPAFCLIVCLAGGCVGEKVLEELKGDIKNISLLTADTSTYYVENGKWPETIEDLKDFCSENSDKCMPVEWNKFASISFQTLPDERLKIEGEQSREQGKYSFNMVLDVPKQE